ncbi:hypothetical protein AYI92_10220 [Shewanella xiamenensis]|nr:hypothetical protein CEQ32_02245 [Shewanella sp. FDAARGOS_354]ODR87601.1 hypothetical protein ABT47_21260 [Shewanella xiamenensis]TVL19888.1 hypothetical protein AYI90_09400 [Shewanella xiamenensis]TVL20144.1 hypothetical protein AYI91_10195 [Shewanella xiamenensis]TVL26323.1 hypothetical protein AYI92_10220 [Shewanella xiamenensis]
MHRFINLSFSTVKLKRNLAIVRNKIYIIMLKIEVFLFYINDRLVKSVRNGTLFTALMETR